MKNIDFVMRVANVFLVFIIAVGTGLALDRHPQAGWVHTLFAVGSSLSAMSVAFGVYGACMKHPRPQVFLYQAMAGVASILVMITCMIFAKV